MSRKPEQYLAYLIVGLMLAFVLAVVLAVGLSVRDLGLFAQ